MVTRLIAGRKREAIALAVALFIAIFVVRTTVGSLADAISFLYVAPVVLVAITLGTRGGAVAGAVAFALSTASALIADQPTSAFGYFNRAVVFLFIGALVGRFAEDLRSLEAESTRFFDLSRDMICVAGFDGYFKRVNPAFERTLGYSHRELLERPFVEFVHPDDRDDTDVETGEISDGGRATVHFQNRYLDKDGGVHWIEWTSVGVPDEERIYAVARDVTERKLLEQELELRSRSDPLTGTLNRRSFDEVLAAQLAQARRYKRRGALLIADLDRFKQINDEFGHAAGDEALRLVSRVFAETCARPTPSAATRAAWSPASGATSSPCCCPRPTPPAPKRWGRGWSPRWPPSPCGSAIGRCGWGSASAPPPSATAKAAPPRTSSLQPIVRCTWSRQQAAVALL